MKSVSLFVVAIAFLAMPGLAQIPFSDFELVESVPVETNLDNPALRNALDVWLEMIRGAQKTLDIEQFYVSNQAGEPLEQVIQAICEAGQRGVQVRFISDRKFYRTYPETLDKLAKQANIEVRTINFSAIKDGVQHAKFFIIDGELVFVGSQNFDWRSLKHIRELGVRVRHRPLAQSFTDLFEVDWELCKAENPQQAIQQIPKRSYPLPFSIPVPGEEPIMFAPVWAPKEISPDEGQWSLKAILGQIQQAKKEININLLRYSPVARDVYWPEIDVALRTAAARGVKVRIIVADWCKSHPQIDHLKSLTVVPNITVKLSTIPQHSSGFIPFARVTHAKFMTIDDFLSWIGCGNWEKGYFYNTRDVGVVVNNKKFNETLRNLFQKDWESEYTSVVRPEVEYTPPKIG